MIVYDFSRDSLFLERNLLNLPTTVMDLKLLVRDIPDFPKPGIMFRDITTLLSDPVGLCYTIDSLAEKTASLGLKADYIIGMESRGFIIGAPLSWSGQGYRGCERSSGSVDMATGLALSENAIALRVAQDVGLDKVVKMATRLGVTSSLNPVPGLVLGQSEVNVLEMTGAFGAISNQGKWNRAHLISRILDSSDCTNREDLKTCRVIYDFSQSPNANVQVLSPQVADTMTAMLRGVVERGTGRSAAIGFGEAGKTGTTNNNVDLWFIGFLPRQELVTGVWLGNDNNSPTSGSSAQAARLWSSYMRKVVP